MSLDAEPQLLADAYSEHGCLPAGRSSFVSASVMEPVRWLAVSEDEILVAEIRLGDLAAEDRLVRKFRNKLVSMLGRLTRQIHKAEDLAQETLLLVIQKLRQKEIDIPSKLASYIFSTARYLYLSGLRKMDNKVELNETMDDVSSGVDDPEVAYVGAENSKTVGLLIDKLAVSRDREILTRRYLVDQSKGEICAAMMLSALHYDRVISRARIRLKACIAV